MNHGFPVVFALVMDLAGALGVSQINKMPGCWEYAFGDFTIAVNGHRETIKDSKGSDVPSYHASIERRGWPVAMVSPAGGMAIGLPESEIETALREEIARVKAAS